MIPMRQEAAEVQVHVLDMCVELRDAKWRMESISLACDALKTLPLIGVYTEGWNWDSYFEALGLGSCPSRNCIVVDTLIVALEMAARAEGVALVNGPFADDDLLSGRLVNPTGQVIAGRGEWGAVCHRKLAQDARVAILLNWLHVQSQANPSQARTK